jgi:biotin transport system permease protein
VLALYIHRDSAIHRLRPGAKILLSLAGSALLFATGDIALLVALTGAVVVLYPAARLPLGVVLATLRPVLIVCAIIFALQLAFSGLPQAITAVLRIIALVLLTSLVTLTTRLSDMLDTLTSAARGLAPFGVDPPKIALAVGLTIRFIPMLLRDIEEVQNARKTRGGNGFGLMAAGPLIIKILRMTDAVGNAIAARGFENRK